MDIGGKTAVTNSRATLAPWNLYPEKKLGTT
jgi:hypothetical protein